ncbi:hypothetical protein QQF64_027068 [Cirrhinus molitorella]|uniref:non-specific serine/threonine protein kinase n=1 Tax=Cirrhinus molitorella TaxID=172907 RepID=A0ABR3NBI3_9TELE
MGQCVNKVSPMTVGEVYEQHPSTPPTPSTNMEVQHPHPRNETPVGAGGGGREAEEEKERKEAGRVKEKRKSKKLWQKLRTFFRAAKKHLESSSGQEEVEQQQQEDEGEKSKEAGRSSDDYNCVNSRYSVGDQLGKGGFGVVYEGRRLEDGLKPDHPNPLLKEITLTIMVNKGRRVPEIIRLLNWTDHPDHFVMVLICPSPCENLEEFMRRDGGTLDEDTSRQIMWQAVNTTHMCCLRRVLCDVMIK